MAEINKPLIAVASGHAKNSGAAFLAACAHPMTTHDCRISFNEATFGFVPHAGASFYMSRMKGEFGTFMALTGLQIHGTEATRLDLTRGTVYDPKNFEMDVSDQVSQLPWPLYGGNE
jgi:enoyl-CoA hydratase/carnithine racemase